MENASKALLIAGAILLVIAIIAIAVGIVSSTRGAIDTAENQISSMEIQMHNEHFKMFEGKRKTYNDLKNIFAEITAYNSKTTNNNFRVLIHVYQYSNENHLNVTGLICEETSWGIINGECSIFVENFLYDVAFEYNSAGIINFMKLIKYNKPI